MSGGGGSSTTTSGPPKWQLPYLQQGLQGAQNMYQAGGAGVVPFSPETEQALTGTAARATNGNAGMTAAQTQNTNTINGGFMGANPYLDQTFNRAAMQTQNQLASQFAHSGRNIDASQDLRSGQLNDLATGIYGGAYDSERNRMQQSIGMAQGLANQDYVDLGQLANVGAQREGLAQDQANAPGFNLDQYLGRISGNMGTSTTQPANRNRAAGAIGGAMMGSQLGGQSPWGQAAGGLLGGYLGGWG